MNQRGMQRGMRAVASFEAVKGILVLLAGFGAFRLMHHDVRALAVEVVGWLRLNLRAGIRACSSRRRHM